MDGEGVDEDLEITDVDETAPLHTKPLATIPGLSHCGGGRGTDSISRYMYL